MEPRVSAHHTGAGRGWPHDHHRAFAEYRHSGENFEQKSRKTLLTSHFTGDKIILPHAPGYKCVLLQDPPPRSEFLERGRCLEQCTLSSRLVESSIAYRKAIFFIIEKLNAEADSTVEFDRVIAAGNDGDLKFGTPTVEGAKVTAKVIKNGKSKKITVFTYQRQEGFEAQDGSQTALYQGSDRSPSTL